MEGRNNYLKPTVEIMLGVQEDIIATSDIGSSPFVGEDDEFNIHAETL